MLLIMIAMKGIIFKFLNHIRNTYVRIRTTNYIFKGFSYFREFPTTETQFNVSKMETIGNETVRKASPRLLATVYIIAVVSAGIILIWVILQKRRKGNVIDITPLLCRNFHKFCV